MSNKTAIAFYGIDLGKDDLTVYWLYCDGQYESVTEEQYRKLVHERGEFAGTSTEFNEPIGTASAC